MKKQRQAIVVLTPGRSGSSLLMQILDALGMTISDDVIGASEQNPVAPYEDAFIQRTLMDIFRQLGSSQQLPFASDWFDSEVVGSAKRSLMDHVCSEIDKASTTWGFKSPATALLLPMWFYIFNAKNISPKYLLVTRNPASVVNSMVTQYRTDPATAELFWLNKTCEAIRQTGGNFFIVQYEELFTDNASKLVAKLADYTGLNQFFSNDYAEVILSVVKPRLNRSRHKPYTVRNRWVNQLYDCLKTYSAADFNPDPLMEVVGQCEQAMSEFIGWPIAAQKIIKNKIKKVKTIEKQVMVSKECIDKQKIEIEAVKKISFSKHEEYEKQLKSVLEESERKAALREEEINQTLTTERALAKERQASFEKQLYSIRTDTEELYKANQQLIRENKDLQDENKRIQAKLSSKHEEYEKQLKSVLEESERITEEVQMRIQSLVEENAKLVRESKRIKDVWVKERVKLLTSLKDGKNQGTPIATTVDYHKIHKWQRKTIELETSYSFRLGQIMVNSILKPGENTVLMPYYLTILFWDIVSGRGRTKTKQLLKDAGR